MRSGPLVLLIALSGCQGPPNRVADDAGPQRNDAVVDAARADAAVLTPHASAPIRGTYVVVTADPLVEIAEKMSALRRSVGYVTAVHRVSALVPGPVQPRDLAAKVHRLLADTAGVPPTHLLLLGDAPGPDEQTSGQIPAFPCTSHYGGCMTDNPYGDLDGDGLPDVAVGRIPARTPRQATEYLERLEAHERSFTPGPWNRRVSIYTERGGFGARVDALIELGMMEGLKRVSHAFDIVGAYDNPNSQFFYTPYSEKVIDLFNQGNLFVFYVGHGLSGSTAGLDKGSLDAVHCGPRRPAVFFFACNNGAYVGPNDSIAEALLLRDRGAIVAFASTDVSHPYGNASLLYEVTRHFLDGRPATFGEGLRRAKRALMEHSDEFRQILD
ncbi:MAG: hypothetical protein JRI55_21700, partial [Deltaproteobacteria bacterium]|nr:hypothetical protein [Deltaproteobacteria bacterium]